MPQAQTDSQTPDFETAAGGCRTSVRTGVSRHVGDRVFGTAASAIKDRAGLVPGHLHSQPLRQPRIDRECRASIRNGNRVRYTELAPGRIKGFWKD